MNSAIYLLLRNNRESGPYYLQQLIEMGLKPYDLIWVHGKSAAWRYPSEVDELKEFAPIVEEQPFDRFYKKPEEKVEKHFHEIIEEAESIKKVKLQKNSDKILNTETKKTVPKIFVSMPEQSVLSIGTVKLKEIVQEKTIEKTESIVQVERHDLVSEKNESSIDDLKSFYANTYKKRTQKNIRNKNTKKIIEYSVAALFLLSLSMLVFLYFRPGETMPIVNLTAQKNNFTEKRLESVNNDENKDAIVKIEEPVKSQEFVPVELKNSNQPEKKINTNVLKENADTKEKESEDFKAATISTVREIQRQKSVRDELPATEKTEDIFNLVSVKANDYKKRAFGGIENLQLTVENGSNFILDKIVVELQYLKPSELPLKTEKIEFSSIAPKGFMMLKIPDSPRGIKVQYKITSIESTQFDKYMAGL